MDWARGVREPGGGEILLTSMDRDGVRTGYDLELTRRVADAVRVPVIASGGAGGPEHIRDALDQGSASAALLAGILHDGLTTVTKHQRIPFGMGRWRSDDRSTTMTDRQPSKIFPGLDSLSFWENGLLPVVAQDAETGKVLMVAFANREALEKTLVTGQMHYWSRSRNELWHKGATSGNFQDLVSLHADCDSDTLLARVRPRGPACHTGEETCFGSPGSAGAESGRGI